MVVLSLRFRRCGLGERCLQDTPASMMSGKGDVIDHLPTCLCSTQRRALDSSYERTLESRDAKFGGWREDGDAHTWEQHAQVGREYVVGLCGLRETGAFSLFRLRYCSVFS